MPVLRDIMVPDPLVVAPELPLREAARLMHERNINSLVVCRDGRVEGILTSRDVLRQAGSDDDGDPATVAAFMTPSPITLAADASFGTAMEAMDRRHIRHLPVMEDDRLVGIVSIRDLLHHRAALLEELVRAQTAELHERYAQLQERDRHMHLHLEMAARIQRELLPAAPPHFPPIALAVAHRPLQQVSGDSYDFAVPVPDRLAILVADARGHGVPAAFVSVMARMVFRSFGPEGESPAGVLRALNDRLPRLILADHFLTMVYAVVDRRSLRLTYATAGHPPPLWCRRSRDVEPLSACGDMIGVTAEPLFEERTVQLRRGDRVLFYTDGLIEARDAIEPLGRERVAAALRTAAAASSHDALDSVLCALDRFRGQRALEDDVTCIALAVE